MSNRVTTPASPDVNAWVYPATMIAVLVLGLATSLYVMGQGLMAAAMIVVGLAVIGALWAKVGTPANEGHGKPAPYVNRFHAWMWFVGMVIICGIMAASLQALTGDFMGIAVTTIVTVVASIAARALVLSLERRAAAPAPAETQP